MLKKIVRYFDKLEDRIRGRLSRYPIIYTFIGGVGIVLFWRGVWVTTDQLSLYLPENLYWLNGVLSVAVSCLLLLMTGLFVSFFITDKIILSGLKQEKKLVEREAAELREEADEIKHLSKRFELFETILKDIKARLDK
ncbi:MAG: hypothetical protein V4519_04360 [Patescibacteria group bacterium]